MTVALPEVEVVIKHGPLAEFMRDDTRQIDLEGGFRAGKTTAALWKVRLSCQQHPGIHWLCCRFGDGETQSILRPDWIKVCLLAGVTPEWNAQEQCDVFPNGSRVFFYGLKASDLSAKYSKLRGRTLAGVYVDQAEELPREIYMELTGRLSQQGYPHQLLLTPNPSDENHWLAQEFPETNAIQGRRYYSVSIYDNAHNLDPDVIRDLEATYPPSHPKHRPAILGKRGLDVVGDPVYAGCFVRNIHVRSLDMNPRLPLYEAIDFGKHHPCVVWAQYTPYAQLLFLGGILGQNIPLEDFVDIIKSHRAQWFPNPLEVHACCDPAGSHSNSQGFRQNGVMYLRDHGIPVTYHENANAPDVRLTMVDRLMGYMRRRTAAGEALGVDDRRWLRISPTDATPMGFVADGFEAGYVWDKNEISVGNKRMRRPKKDGWYEHGMNCCEYLELSYGGHSPSQAEANRIAARLEKQAQERAQRDVDEWDHVTTRLAKRSRRGTL